MADARQFLRRAGRRAAAGAGQVLVRNLFMSVDPYMRGRMNDVKSYVPPFQIGEPLQGGAIGEVVESRDASIRPATSSRAELRLARDAVATGDGRPAGRTACAAAARRYLGAARHDGHDGLGRSARRGGRESRRRGLRSGAAGAVGSVAGQIAKLRGCYGRSAAPAPPRRSSSLTSRNSASMRAFNYKDGDRARAAARGGARGHRRVLRQRRRRPSRGGARRR